MQQVLAIFGVVALGVFGFALANIRSDIQVIIAVVGLFSGVILFGLSEVVRLLKRMDQ